MRTAEDFESLRKLLGDSLKFRMSMAGVSVKELAGRMKVSPAFVSQLRSGRENMTLETIFKLEAALGDSLIEIR